MLISAVLFLMAVQQFTEGHYEWMTVWLVFGSTILIREALGWRNETRPPRHPTTNKYPARKAKP